MLLHLNPIYKKQLIKIIQKHLPSCKIYLFGSRARLQHKEGADADLALDNKAPIEQSILCNLRFDIEESNIPLFVDIVDVNDADEEFLDVIKKEWIEWKL